MSAIATSQSAIAGKSADPCVVQLRAVSKIYTSGEVQVKAVNGVSLAIERGDFVGIMGASGSGKSTMMNIIGCLDRPTSGQYLLDGVDVASLSRKQLAQLRNHRIGFVFQSFNLLARTTAMENVELPLFYTEPTIPLRERHQRSRAALEKVGLGARLSHRPSQLSGGQQQRIAIARALVNNPTLLLADEPTGNLDTRTSIEIMGLFQQLNDTGMTVVMVTHELDVAAYCKRVVVMRDGHVIEDRHNSNPSKADVMRTRLDDEERNANIGEQDTAT